MFLYCIKSLLANLEFLTVKNNNELRNKKLGKMIIKQFILLTTLNFELFAKMKQKFSNSLKKVSFVVIK